MHKNASNLTQKKKKDYRALADLIQMVTHRLLDPSAIVSLNCVSHSEFDLRIHELKQPTFRSWWIYLLICITREVFANASIALVRWRNNIEVLVIASSAS